MKHVLFLTIFFSLGLPFDAEAGTKTPVEAEVPVPRNGPFWKVGGGAFYRTYGDLSITGGSRSPSYLLPSFTGRGQNRLLKLPSGPEGDKIYADGFLRPDSGTVTDGSTAYWGYDSSSQISGDSLRYRSSGSESTVETSSFSEALSHDENVDDLGAFLSLSAEWQMPRGWEVSVDGVFSWNAFDAEDSGNSFQFVESRRDYSNRIMDSYYVGDIIPPDAPYAGSLDQPGPLIDGTPSRVSSRSKVYSDEAQVFNKVDREMDFDHYTLSFGSSLGRSWGPWNARLGGGIALHILAWEASQQEDLFLQHKGSTKLITSWQDKSSDTDLLAGIYAQIQTQYRLTSSLSFMVNGRYDWVDSFEASAGTANFSLPLDGWSLGAGLLWSF
jgi:hypothetical protein